MKLTSLADLGQLKNAPQSSDGGWQDAPLPVLPTPKISGFVDLTGQKIGRLRVIGYAGPALKQRSALWVVQCACGRYSRRRSSNLRAPDAAQRAHCQRCID